MSDHAEAVCFGVCADDYRRSPSDEAPLTRLRFLLVLEGPLDFHAVNELAAVPDVNVLLDDLGDTKVPDRLTRRFNRVRGSLLLGGRACADDVDHPVNTHVCPPRWMCRSARFGTVMISHSRAEGNQRASDRVGATRTYSHDRICQRCLVHSCQRRHAL